MRTSPATTAELGLAGPVPAPTMIPVPASLFESPVVIFPFPRRSR